MTKHFVPTDARAIDCWLDDVATAYQSDSFKLGYLESAVGHAARTPRDWNKLRSQIVKHFKAQQEAKQ